MTKYNVLLMAEQAQIKTNLGQSQSSLKALLVKGLDLKYPISSGRYNKCQFVY